MCPVTYDTDLYFAGSPQAAPFQSRVDISRWTQKGVLSAHSCCSVPQRTEIIFRA